MEIPPVPFLAGDLIALVDRKAGRFHCFVAESDPWWDGWCWLYGRSASVANRLHRATDEDCTRWLKMLRKKVKHARKQFGVAKALVDRRQASSGRKSHHV